ncbi:MAG: hypothetical protein HS111_27365 [Kofleriaceae bacterium]|nr:hypothetical protein [Kofleriaceae bacterium]MCL4225116.1 hypothetical protein [Myxococcales bacterium]
MIQYEFGPGPLPGVGRTPEGPWIRLIPYALCYPTVVEAIRREQDGFVLLDQVYDLKLAGDRDLFGAGPNLLVSEDFALAFRAGGFEGLELHEAPHATPLALRVRPLLSCRPTHYAATVTDRVALVPPTHARGRPYGYAGRPAEPLEIVAPLVAPNRLFGGPWFATASLPFQPLIVPARFLESFRAIVGRPPALGWAEVRIIDGNRQPLVPRAESFAAPPTVPRRFGYASSAEALDAARRDASLCGHVVVGSAARPGSVPPAVWRELAPVTGSIFFRGAFGLFPATEADRAAMDPARITARNVAEYSVLADPLTHASSLEIGYPLEADWIPIGWFAGEMPSLIAVTPTGEVRRCEANGELNLHYPRFGDFFADVMADLTWAEARGRYRWQWLGA